MRQKEREVQALRDYNHHLHAGMETREDQIRRLRAYVRLTLQSQKRPKTPRTPRSPRSARTAVADRLLLQQKDKEIACLEEQLRAKERALHGARRTGVRARRPKTRQGRLAALRATQARLSEAAQRAKARGSPVPRLSFQGLQKQEDSDAESEASV